MMKKYLALILLVSTVTASYETAHAEPISTLSTIIALGVATRTAIKNQEHCGKLCVPQVCGSETLNRTKDALNKFLGPSNDSTLGSGLRNVGEFCLNTCTTDAPAIFFSLPDAENPSAKKTISVSVKKRFGNGWDIKACAQAYSKLAESKETTFLYPKSNQAFVYSEAELSRLSAFSKANDFSGYAAWHKDALHEALGINSPE